MTDDLDEGQAALDAAFASGRDRGADDAAPASEPVKDLAPDPDGKSDKDTPEGDGKDDPKKQYRDPETGRFVPLTELKSERSKRQEEARLRTEAEMRAARAEAALQEARRYAESQFRQPQQQAPQPAQEIPDPFVDPEGYQRHVAGEARMAALNERLNVSQMLAEEKYGAEKIEAALKVAAQSGAMQHFIAQRNPYASLVQWYDHQTALAKIGDPTTYEAEVEKRVREKVLAELKQGSASQQQRFPGTLADASASGGQGAVLSEQAMLDAAFSSDRRVRRR